MKPNAAIHEDFARGVEVTNSSDRSFGLTFTGFFLLVGLWPLVRGGPVRTWALVLATIFLVLLLVRPRLLAPLNRLWLRVGLLLHRVVNPLVMCVMFYGVITPMGLVMRWFGRDPLRLHLEPDVPSYWIERRPPGPAPDTMSNQF
jgi:hypothetical protein